MSTFDLKTNRRHYLHNNYLDKRNFSSVFYYRNLQLFIILREGEENSTHKLSLIRNMRLFKKNYK